MYYRLKNQFEAEFLKDVVTNNNIPLIVLERMHDVLEILDTNYGTSRTSSAMGGYVLFFPTKESYLEYAPTIYQHYNIDSTLYEYDDELSSTDNMSWREKLYLLSSDDSLIFIYSE